MARPVLSQRGNMVKGLAAWLLVAGVLAASAPGPRAVVESAVERVISMLEESVDAATDAAARRQTAEDRRTQIRRIASELFDFDEMARRALSRSWAARTPAERDEFVRLFTDVLERAYLGRIEAYAGERIVYLGETVDGAYATVRSRILDRRNVETPVEYRLHRRSGRWRVYDVVIDHASFVARYRSEFGRVLQHEGYEALVERLRQRAGVPATAADSALPRVRR
ncbi:MAG TPA: ABC transporter substrate-binding protein [Candidatus Tectomicrobia bacterium]|nr:ABC transporter substrate-binding protein [Candidatus Tectomicrobia bacterium]